VHEKVVWLPTAPRCDQVARLSKKEFSKRRDALVCPFEVRKATLKSLLAKAGPGLRLNEHIEADGPTVFAHACKMGLEGIVSKHKASTYRSGRSPDWLKCKNPACEAVKREAEEDWSR
jgi:ATP-dependent DNA ligase